jgi:ribosomal protein S18 acetylase RimI-like enzyme
MTAQEIICCVNGGANFYLRFFGNAMHMEYNKNDFYSFIKPKQGEHGVKFAFDIKLENIPVKEQIKKIEEIRALNMPVWWDLQSSDGLYKLIHGKDREKTDVLTDGDELYMAILPTEQINTSTVPENMIIKKVNNSLEFEEWATAVNTIMAGGYTDIHPVNHYFLCENGSINCFSCYHENNVVAVASIMNNEGVCSLEFVATDPNYRRQGLARAVCLEAMKYAFDNGAKIITLRAMNPGTREFYTSIGFTIYNYAL